MTYQEVLVLVTKSSQSWPGFRDDVTRQIIESGHFASFAMSVTGLNTRVNQIGTPVVQHYATPLHALGDGWKLLVPPKTLYQNLYEWWFVKEV